MNTESIIDLQTYEALKEAVGSDFIGELLQAYFEETPQLLEQLSQALDKLDSTTFRRAAHSIKSSGRNFGAMQLGELAYELEKIGQSGELVGANEKVEQLAISYNAVKAALEGLENSE